jgi:hypothetical protein
MKSKLAALTLAFAVLASCCAFNLEAKSRTRFGVSFGSYRTAAPVYVAPQPVYVYPNYAVQGYPVAAQPASVVYAAPAPVVYTAPAPVVYTAPRQTSGFSFSFGSFWK